MTDTWGLTSFKRWVKHGEGAYDRCKNDWRKDYVKKRRRTKLQGCNLSSANGGRAAYRIWWSRLSEDLPGGKKSLTRKLPL